MVWFSVALEAPDQLRQRVAWALSQILVTGEDGVGKTRETEVWANYYDIFVRHAFGSYIDVLREVAYSPMMAKVALALSNHARAHAPSPVSASPTY
eukprot:653959-Prymnesium_polylepis.3